MNELNLNIKQNPGAIELNFDEIEAALDQKLAEYKGAVFTEESKTYAKKEVASLRKFKERFETVRKNVKREWMKPYDEFEERMKEMELYYKTAANGVSALLKKFIDEVVNVRIPNPFMPDTPQRIATDTSQKLSIRFGETIKAYAASPDLDVKSLKCIPLVFAAWLRYVMGVDDEGKTFEPSADPLLAYAQDAVKGIGLGYTGSLDQLHDILSNQKIFGVDLYEVGLADLVIEYFRSMIAAPGAVRATLKKVVG